MKQVNKKGNIKEAVSNSATIHIAKWISHYMENTYFKQFFEFWLKS